jgi:cell division protein FtsB
MLTTAAIKILGAFSVAFLLLYIFSDRGIVREGAKGCSKQAQNVAITQQSEIDNINSNNRVMKAELEQLKKQIGGYKAEIQYNEQQLKQVLAQKKKDIPAGMQKQ